MMPSGDLAVETDGVCVGTSKYFGLLMLRLFPKTDSAGAHEAQRVPAPRRISPFSPPRAVLPGNEFLLMGELGFGNIKSGLWALGAGAQT